MGRIKKLIESFKCSDNVSSDSTVDEPLEITVQDQSGVSRVVVYVNKSLPSTFMEALETKLRLDLINEGFDIKSVNVCEGEIYIDFKDNSLKEALAHSANTILNVTKRNITDEDIKKGE